MSPLDNIFGWIMVGLCGIAFLALVVIGIAAWRFDKAAQRDAARAAAKAAHPAGREFEKSAYQLTCNAHRPHVMASTTDGQWICTRCQQTWANDDDFAQWEREVSA